MCAIIGYNTDNFSYNSYLLLKELFVQSSIRGRHASGMSFYDGKKIITHKDSISGERFINSFEYSYFPKKLKLIGHCRYSTSDLDYNQPISDDNSSIVHNGVITQEDFSNWEDHFNQTFNTRNDTEILFNKIKEHGFSKNIFEGIEDSSQAVIWLEKNKIHFYRNGKRPAWIANTNLGTIVTSTRDILIRVRENLDFNLEIRGAGKIPCGYLGQLLPDNIEKVKKLKEFKDLQ